MTFRFGPLGDFFSFLSGALLTLAFAPFDFFPLAILAPALLLWLLDEVTARRAAMRGALFGLGLFGTGIYWIYISLHDYGHAPPAFAAVATFAVVLLMMLYTTAFAYCLNRLTPSPGALKWLLVAPALWILLEWIRSWLFTGFPWLSLGYSQIDSPLNGIAVYLGMFGISWAVMLSAGALQILLCRPWFERLTAGVLALVLWLGAWVLGQISWVTPAGEPFQVSVVQGNIAQDEKFAAGGIERALKLYAELSRTEAEGSALIVWPETAIPIFYTDLSQSFIDDLLDHTRRANVDYLTGIPTGSWEERIFHNAVVSLGKQHGFYHKRRLLPFGEYIPMRFILNFFSDFVDIPMGDFTAGAEQQDLLQAAAHPVGVSICFEAAFGSEIRRALPAAHFLVNVSNDAWFGRSLAPYQHLQIARMRALETGRFMARATNTGISAFIDERGRVLEQSELFKVQVLTSQIQPLSGATPYVTLGDKGVVLLAGIILGIALLLERGWTQAA